MYLSRIALEGGSRDTMRLLASPHMLHGAVEQCFIGERQRRLWRVDYLHQEPYLIILSEAPPNFEKFAARYGRTKPSPCWAVKSYDALLSRIEAGQLWRFRLRANPVRSSPERGGGRKRGKVYNHVTREHQKAWLQARAAANGFSLAEDSFDVVHAQWLKFRKEEGRSEVSILAVTFEGVLTVLDPGPFRAALLNGIGRGKAYGCGLLTIASLAGQ